MDAARKNSKRYGKVVKKKYGKKRSTKKFSKKRYSKKSKKNSKRRSTRRVVSSFFHVPTGYAIYGMDVSKYQGTIDWANLNAPENYRFNIGFAFMKATEGVEKKDPRFESNWLGAAQNGVKRGAYHFYRPNQDVYLQAQNFISSVRLSSGDLAPVIDCESRGTVTEEKFQADLKIFCTLLEKEYGVKPIIYTGYRFYHNHLSSSEFAEYPFWVAHYGKKDLSFLEHWKFWQFTDHGRVKGIKGAVDLNVFKGGMYELNQLCLK
ncbi:MAG: GH25 family lysozyme [Bacteroidota bacterium]